MTCGRLVGGFSGFKNSHGDLRIGKDNGKMLYISDERSLKLFRKIVGLSL